MKQNLLFIIIPIYNVERYLRECLESVANQTYTNFKAILINDGSTDSSPQIAQEFCEKDERFVLLTQENSGVSVARNLGLDYVAKILKWGGQHEDSLNTQSLAVNSPLGSHSQDSKSENLELSLRESKANEAIYNVESKSVESKEIESNRLPRSLTTSRNDRNIILAKSCNDKNTYSQKDSTHNEIPISLQNATNAYVGFVDSDDVIARDYYENLIYTAKKTKTKISKSSDVRIFDDNHYNKSMFDIRLPKFFYYAVDSTNPNVSKMEVYRAIFEWEVVKNLRFIDIKIAEDVVFSTCANLLVEKVSYNFFARYFYRQRSDSAMKTAWGDDGDTPQLYRAFMEIVRFFRENDLFKKHQIPTGFIRPNIEYISKNNNDFLALQKFVLSLNIPQSSIDENKILKALLDSQNIDEFIAKTANFKEKFKSKFQIRFSRKKNIIKLFGKIFYEKIKM